MYKSVTHSWDDIYQTLSWIPLGENRLRYICICVPLFLIRKFKHSNLASKYTSVLFFLRCLTNIDIHTNNIYVFIGGFLGYSLGLALFGCMSKKHQYVAASTLMAISAGKFYLVLRKKYKTLLGNTDSSPSLRVTFVIAILLVLCSCHWSIAHIWMEYGHSSRLSWLPTYILLSIPKKNTRYF